MQFEHTVRLLQNYNSSIQDLIEHSSECDGRQTTI